MSFPFKHPPLESMFVTSKFGMRKHPVDGKQKLHAGIDLRAAVGTPIFAPFSGLAHTRTSTAGGNIVSITNLEGWTVNLMHCSAFKITGPVDVVAGEVVALAGKSGQVDGPHLHLELRPPDGAQLPPQLTSPSGLIDPGPFLFGEGDGAGGLVALAAAAGYLVFS